MEFEATLLQQTPHGCFPEVKAGPQFMSLIIILVSARFTLSPLPSKQCFHAACWVSNSTKLSAIITNSSICNMSQGRVLLNYLKRFSRTITNSKGLKTTEPLPYIKFVSRSVVYSDHTAAVPIHCHHSPY